MWTGRSIYPLQDEYRTCPVCGQETLKLMPCSHWDCHHCNYDTNMNREEEIAFISKYVKKTHKRITVKQIEKFVKCPEGFCRYTLSRCIKDRRKGDCRREKSQEKLSNSQEETEKQK